MEQEHDLARLAQQVTWRRVERGMRTQAALAEAAGLSVRLINEVERRRKMIGASSRSAIEAALDWPAGRMVKLAGDQEAAPSTEPSGDVREHLAALLERLDALAADVRAALDRLDDAAS